MAEGHTCGIPICQRAVWGGVLSGSLHEVVPRDGFGGGVHLGVPAYHGAVGWCVGVVEGVFDEAAEVEVVFDGRAVVVGTAHVGEIDVVVGFEVGDGDVVACEHVVYLLACEWLYGILLGGVLLGASHAGDCIVAGSACEVPAVE